MYRCLLISPVLISLLGGNAWLTNQIYHTQRPAEGTGLAGGERNEALIAVSTDSLRLSGFHQWLSYYPDPSWVWDSAFWEWVGNVRVRVDTSSQIIILHLSGVSLTSVALLPLTWKKVKVLVSQLCLTLCDPMDEVSLSIQFSRQEYWSGLPFPSPGDLPDPGVEPGSPAL